MLKKTLLGLVISLGLSSNLVASDLKADMAQIGATMTEANMGFLTNNKAATLAAIIKLKKEAHGVFTDKKTITALLPDDVKYKASIAINSAQLIEKYTTQIEEDLNNRSLRMINKQMRTQKAFVEIQKQCFRCHNLVRDWQ